MTEQVVDAGANASLANSLIAGALQETDSVPAQPVEMPKVAPPPDREVKLIAGLVNALQGTSETDAVVRELTGADEEALTSPQLARSVPKYLAAIAQRGTESIGEQKPLKKEHLDSLLIGDRELLLIGIRKATYGVDLELITRCPNCGETDESYVFDLSTIEVKALENPDEAVYGFNVDLPSGIVAHVNYPTAADQDALLSAEDKNEGELNTLMLSRVVDRIDERMVVSPEQVRALSIRDRKAILKAINDRTPGPQLGKAKRTCGACEQEFDLGIGLLDIFRA